MNGELIHGGAALQVSDSKRTSGGLPNLGNVQYRFRLTSDFTSGNLELRAFADDLDPFDHVVDGQPHTLARLPRKAFVAPVVVH